MGGTDWGCTKTRDSQYSPPKVAGSPYNTDPNKVPLIWETPDCGQLDRAAKKLGTKAMGVLQFTGLRFIGFTGFSRVYRV